MTQQQTTAAPRFEQTHITMVLDRSGSMAGSEGATIGMVNSYLKEARSDHALKEADFQLTLFDSEGLDDIRSGAPIAISDLTREDYLPRASTPLYDAIGRGIDSLEARCKASGSGKAILIVITDGQENWSRRYSLSAIKERIKGREAAGWLVVFLGAGLDVAKQGLALGAAMAQTASFAMDEASMQSMAQSIYRSSSGYGAQANLAQAKQYMATGAASFTSAQRLSMGDKTAGQGLAGAMLAPVGIPKPGTLAGLVVAAAPPVADSWDASVQDAFEGKA